jgi:hypothetical protein
MIMSGVDFAFNPHGGRAEAARKWFTEHGPPDMQPLPLGYAEREALKDGSLKHILALFARSLADQNYDVEKHPSFYDYVCGVMASSCSYAQMFQNPELLQRFPPRLLEGLDAHLYWKLPKSPVHAKASETPRVLH